VEVAYLQEAVQLISGGAQSVRAYLDPGSGSFLLQLIISGLLGGLLAAKVFWRKLRSLFGRKPADNDREERDDG
jgi:hypothetical protein